MSSIVSTSDCVLPPHRRHPWPAGARRADTALTAVVAACRERRNVALTLVDNDEVIHTLQSLVGAVLHTVAAFAYLALLGVHIAHLLISLSSAGLAFVFVFGNNLRTVYESLVFLFMIRPYQVGDCIRFKGELHWVRNFGLLTTQFTRFDGCRIWVRPAPPLQEFWSCV